MDQQNNRKRKDLRQILKEPKLKHKIFQSSDGKLTVPNVKRLARKPGQRHRLKTLVNEI
jgi:histone H3/H4